MINRTRTRIAIGGAAAVILGAPLVMASTGSALDDASRAVYVSNADGDTVSVINPDTNDVLVDVPVGSEPRNLAASPDRDTVYVPNRHSDNVSVIDTDTNTVVDTIADASFDEPYAVAFTADGSRVYVANKEGGGSTTGSVTVIDTATRAVVDTIDDPCFSSPEGIATNPASGRAYVVNRGDDSVCVINTSTNAVTATVPVGGEPRYAVVTPDGGAVFVSNNTGSVTRIATSDNSTTEIDTPGSPRNMDLSDDGSKVYVALQNSDVAVIDVSDNSVSNIAFTLLRSSYGVTVVPGTNMGFVTDESQDQVAAFSTDTDTETTGAGLPIESAFSTPRAIASLGAAPPPTTTTTTTTTQPGETTTTTTEPGATTTTTAPPAQPAPIVPAVPTFTG